MYLPCEHVQANKREDAIERRQDLFSDVIRGVQAEAGVLENFMGSGNEREVIVSKLQTICLEHGTQEITTPNLFPEKIPD